MPYLVTGAVNVEDAGADFDLRKVRNIEEEAEPCQHVGETHPPDHLNIDHLDKLALKLTLMNAPPWAGNHLYV